MSESNPSSEQGFRVGEVAIYWRPDINVPRNGEECVIVAPLAVGKMNDWRLLGHIEAARYLIKFAGDSVEYAAQPHELRKKPPKREDLQIVRWDQCPWQPEKISV